jgi:hypothetical protein
MKMEKLHQAADFQEFQWNYLLSSFNCFLFEIRGRKLPPSGSSALAEDPFGWHGPVICESGGRVGEVAEEGGAAGYFSR